MKRKLLSIVMLLSLAITGCGKSESKNTEPVATPTPTGFVVGSGSSREVYEIGKVVKVEKIEEGDYNIYCSIEEQDVIGASDGWEPVTKVGDIVCCPYVIDEERMNWGNALLRYTNSDCLEGEVDYIPEIGDGMIISYVSIGGWGIRCEEKDGVKYIGDFGKERGRGWHFMYPYDLSGMVTGEVLSVINENTVKIKVNKDRGGFSIGDEITVAYQCVSKRSSKEVLEGTFYSDEEFFHIDYKLDYEDEVQIKEGDIISFKYGKADLNGFQNEEDETKKKLTPLIVTVVEE